MLKIKDIINFLETIAPLSYQEEYDNSGLTCGNAQHECSGALIALDLTPEIIEEASKNECNLIIVHHPPIFKGLKKLVINDPIAEMLISCIKKDIAVYAIHTNLDNVVDGVNGEIAERLGLQKTRVLCPLPSTHRKMTYYVPIEHAEKTRKAIFDAGAGKIGNYDQCSFNSYGDGTFRALEGANPFVGAQGVQHTEKETKVELLYPYHLESLIIQTLKENHPYETVAYHTTNLENRFDEIGGGIIGNLVEPVSETTFLQMVKKAFHTGTIRHSPFTGQNIQKVAICGGSGKSMINNALREGADVFLTADLGYHDFFIPNGKMLLADMGHFESEQFTSDLILRRIKEKFPTFALLKTGISTNPVNYFL
jgi:dinuclear metal center YbgI/SA1388 family protein